MRFLVAQAIAVSTLIACSQAFAKPEPEANVAASEQPSVSQAAGDDLLGLSPAPIPADNPQSPAKIALGDKLFHDKRFSIDGTVSCANCHDDKKAFTDNLPVSVGHHGLTGTRNTPTVLNAAFNRFQFWGGREPHLEGQSKQPFVNPVEGGLPNHEPILTIVRTDPDYQTAFQSIFGVSDQQVKIDHVAKAIASFERTLVSGNSPFDRYYFKGETGAMTAAQVRGFNLFIGQGRCVSCHTVEQDHALFTDNRFHNIGIGINAIQQDVPRLATAFLKAKNKGGEVDVLVLTDKKSSELGRFAVTDEFAQIGAFKTPTLRNIGFNSVMATAWPWPYPSTFAQAEQYLPKLTVPINRADPFFERDATGWQFINMANGRVDLHFTLYNNTDRVVRFNSKTKRREYSRYQPEKSRILPQTHY